MRFRKSFASVSPESPESVKENGMRSWVVLWAAKSEGHKFYEFVPRRALAERDPTSQRVLTVSTSQGVLTVSTSQGVLTVSTSQRVLTVSRWR